MNYNHGGQASEDPYNGNIEFENETRWRASTDARLEKEARELDIAIAASIEERLSLDGPRGSGNRDYPMNRPRGSGNRDYPMDSPRFGDNRVERNLLARVERTDEKKMPRKYPCDKCDNLFDSHYDASLHRAMHERTWDYGWAAHRERNKGIVSCKRCFISFRTKDELDDHVLRMHPVFSCTRHGCLKCFRSANELEDHVFLMH